MVTQASLPVEQWNSEQWDRLPAGGMEGQASSLSGIHTGKMPVPPIGPHGMVAQASLPVEQWNSGTGLQPAAWRDRVPASQEYTRARCPCHRLARKVW